MKERESWREIEKGTKKLYGERLSGSRNEAGSSVEEDEKQLEEYDRGESTHAKARRTTGAYLKRGLKGTYVAVEPFQLDTLPR